MEDFISNEDNFQALYDRIEMNFKPTVVVCVTLLKFRNVSVGYFSDKVDTPDPQFRVSCPKIQHKHLREFVTRKVPSNVTKGEINETFKFVLPKAMKHGEEFPIVFELYDLDLITSNDLIGRQVIDASSIDIDAPPLQRTLVFGSNNGELDLSIQRVYRTSPDFRYSMGLCPEEKAFRKKRLPFVCKAMQHLFGDKGPKNPTETPVVSMVASGGGYRAVVGMTGAMEALKDAGLLDILTYSCGLSGSAWYLSSSYGHKAVKAAEQSRFHNEIRQQFTDSLFRDFINPATIYSYKQYLKETRDKYDLPHTFVNYFPGFLVGRKMLGQNLAVKLSDITSYIEDGSVPFPLFVALHVKDRIQACKYHAYVERSPYEVYLPSYGVGVKPEEEGSTWSEGFLVRKRVEYPLHFTLAMTGCAFAVLLNAFFKKGGEASKELLEYIDEERFNGKPLANQGLDETGRVAEVESEFEDDDTEDEDEDECISSHSGVSDTSTDQRPPNKLWENIKDEIRSNPFFTSRHYIVGRTARLFNFVLGCENVKRHYLNPVGSFDHNASEAKDLIKKLGLAEVKKSISIKKKLLSFADAGILKNVSTDSVLRPQRTTDLLLVFDFNNYNSDDTFNYKPILQAAAHAWQNGLKFPNVDFEVLTNEPPKEFLVFPGDEDGCPTVLWFTLSNKKFKKLENYIPRSTAVPPDGETRKFNDFAVFGEGNVYETFTFHYDNYNFDQLRELMYYNVMSNVKEIEEAIADATEKKRRRLSRT